MLSAEEGVSPHHCMDYMSRHRQRCCGWTSSQTTGSCSASSSGQGGKPHPVGLPLDSLTPDFWLVLATGRQSQGSRSWVEGGWVPSFPTVLGHLILTPCLPRGDSTTHPTSPELTNPQSCWGQGPRRHERVLGTKSWSLERVRGE